MGYRLKDLKNGQYEIHSPKGAFQGPLKDIYKKSLQLGVEERDLELAVLELNRLGHHSAEFGMAGRFMYTEAKKRNG